MNGTHGVKGRNALARRSFDCVRAAGWDSGRGGGGCCGAVQAPQLMSQRRRRCGLPCLHPQEPVSHELAPGEENGGKWTSSHRLIIPEYRGEASALLRPGFGTQYTGYLREDIQEVGRATV
ncbi:hypothetical protein NDU88_009887 [Pleurodeles waltl]|uniref:Uncharacterized protein n=1 Tax=Pleurodeles waltl TaxID=8319 RepID=A0AAV7QUB6_PLEWA|nr:hypothetical protein NDU88_009887 [Pleurodeles waltl]